MPAPLKIPDVLRTGYVTTAEARAHGVSATTLRRRFVQVHRGLWHLGPPPGGLRDRVEAARRVLPGSVVLSHTSAIGAWGLHLDDEVLHFSVQGSHQTRIDGVALHRRSAPLPAVVVEGFGLVTSPSRAFVDAATVLGLRDLVRAGDFLVRTGAVGLDALVAEVRSCRLDGVRRARRAARLVREGVDSVAETDVRLLLRFARLPEPECNTVILDRSGHAVARGDLPFRAYGVLVEYDGWHHERDARQRQKDHLRRERLEAAGWLLVVVTAADLHDPVGIVRRVHAALVRRGYTGAAPVMSETWRRWFAHDPHDV